MYCIVLTEDAWAWEYNRTSGQELNRKGVENLSPAMGRGINSMNRVWNWVAKLHRLAGRYDNPMPTWFLSPIVGLKLPSQWQDNNASAVLPHSSLTIRNCSQCWALNGHGLLNYGVIQSADPLLRSTHLGVCLPATMNALRTGKAEKSNCHRTLCREKRSGGLDFGGLTSPSSWLQSDQTMLCRAF